MSIIKFIVMALPHQIQSLPNLTKLPFLLAIIACCMLQSCKHSKKLYTSECDADKEFVRISFKQLIDSLENYDQQYVEVSGKYEEDKGISALVCDSLFVDHSSKNALWVNFTQDCPLYLSGTHQGLFEYNDGQFTQINDKAITIRGMIDLHNKGGKKKYKGTIDHVSLIKL